MSAGIKATKSIIDSISTLASKHGRGKRQIARRGTHEGLDEEIRRRTEKAFEAILSDATLDKFGRDRAFQSAAGRIAQRYFDDQDRLVFKDVLEGAEESNGNTDISSLNSSPARPRLTLPTIRAAVDRCWARQFRERILERRSRCDGRYPEQLRLIRCETNLHEPLHGSALFQRCGFSECSLIRKFVLPCVMVFLRFEFTRSPPNAADVKN